MLNYKEGYIICDNHIKMDILEKLQHENSFKNYTFLTLSKLKEMLTFGVSNRGIIELSRKYNVSFDVASFYVDAMKSLNGNWNSKKGLKLKEMYEFLESKDLILKDEVFKYNAKRNHFTFINLPHTKELDYVVSNLNSELIEFVTKDLVIDHKKKEVLSFNNIENECAYVFAQIYELLKSGVKQSDIVICNALADYDFILSRYAHTFNFPISSKSNSGILNTKEAKHLFEMINDGKNFKEIEKELSNYKDKTLVNKIIGIINDYEAYLYEPKDLIEFFKSTLSKVNYLKTYYSEEIKCIKPNELNGYTDKHVFFMNFNVNIPNVLLDDDYISDCEKESLGLDTSISLNEINKKRLINSIKETKNLTITFSEKHTFTNESISPLVKELNMKVSNMGDNDYIFGINKVNDDLYLAKAKDEYIKFNTKNDILNNKYYDKFDSYSYDNTYKEIDKKLIEERYKDGIKLSYSSMKVYLECPFKYYCDKVLKIGEFNNTIYTKVGTFCHAILEDFENLGDKFDFETSKENNLIQDEKDNGPRTPKEDFYYEKYARHMQVVIEKIKEHNNYHAFDKVVCEKPSNISLMDGKLVFTGFIDKILYNDQYVAIIDYKTGSDKASLDNVSDGLNLQLPVYIYFLKNDDEFKNLNLVGFYLQKIDMIIPKKEDGSDIDQITNNIRLEGFTNPNHLSLIDDIGHNYLKDSLYKKDDLKAEFTFVPEDIDRISKLVEKTILDTYNKIMNADFKITDKSKGTTYSGCKYCEYKDVCFKTYKDKVEIESKKYKSGGEF